MLLGGGHFAHDAGGGTLLAPHLLHLLRPQTDLVLEMGVRSLFRGRVVDAHSTRPVADVDVVLLRRSPEGALEEPAAARTDADGRFELAALSERDESTRLELRLAARNGRIKGVHEIVLPRLGSDVDLGDLPLDLGRDVALEFVDARGAPVRGVVVRPASRADVAASRPSDEHGRTILVGAPSFPTTLAVAGDTVLPFEIVLEDAAPRAIEVARASSLVVRVRDLPSDADPTDLRVVVEGVDDASVRTGASAELHRTFGADGTCSIGPFRVGATLRLALEDGVGARSDAIEIAAPEPGGDGEVVLACPRTTARVEGRVRDAFGTALPRTFVAVAGPFGTIERETDADGRFATGPLFGGDDVVRVEARRAEHAPFVLEEFEVVAGAPPLEIVLERARRVAVTVVDAHGRAVDPGFVTIVLDDGRRFLGERTAVGAFAFDALPLVRGTIEADLAGTVVSTPVSTGDTDAVLALPPVGTLRVDASAVRATDGARVCVVVQGDGAGATENRTYFRGDAAGLAPLEIALVVGRYTVRLERRAFGRSVAGEPEIERLGDPRTIEITEGESTRVVLP
ncbi:MAG: hypothetical protein R3F34_09885 [Planctomycetota bacterium]